MRRLERSRTEVVVVVEEGDELPPRQGDAEVPRRSRPAGVGDVAHPPVLAGRRHLVEQCARAVGGPVVDDDDLELVLGHRLSVE